MVPWPQMRRRSPWWQWEGGRVERGGGNGARTPSTSGCEGEWPPKSPLPATTTGGGWGYWRAPFFNARRRVSPPELCCSGGARQGMPPAPWKNMNGMSCWPQVAGVGHEVLARSTLDFRAGEAPFIGYAAALLHGEEGVSGRSSDGVCPARWRRGGPRAFPRRCSHLARIMALWVYRKRQTLVRGRPNRHSCFSQRYAGDCHLARGLAARRCGPVLR